METAFALAFIMLFLFIGEWVSSFTKAYIPSVFISALLFLIGYWTIMPKNITSTATFGTTFIDMAQGALLIHMGTLMSLKTLIKQWKAVSIALLGVIGTVILAMGGGLLLFDWRTVIASVPPLTGGIVAAFLMTNGLKAQHILSLVSFPVSMFVIHSIIGYPLTAFLLKTENKRLLRKFHLLKRKNKGKSIKSSQKEKESDTILHLPKIYQTSALQIFLVIMLTALSMWLSSLTKGSVNPYIICLVVGVIAHRLHVLPNSVLQKAGVFNWFMYGLLAYIFSNLNRITPSNLVTILLPIITMIILGILGMFLASIILAKPLGFSKSMAFASALTALFGFPADYIVTHESANNVGQNEEEREYLLYNTLPKMLVGGFATVSVASVIIASIFLKLL